MAEDPHKHVEAWLEKQGYPLEYQVARMLRAEGGVGAEALRVEEGRHWQDTDPRTGARKGRELDVVATLTGPKSVVRVVVECKHISDPWVIFEHEDGVLATGWDDTADLWMASKPIRQLLSVWYSGGPPGILTPPSGFKVVDARFSDQKRPQPDEPRAAFEAAMQLARGAWALHQSTPRGTTSITFPVLVLEGDLFTVSYDSRGKRRLARADHKRTTWSAAVLEGPQDYVRPWPVIVDVLTTEALQEFVDNLGPALRDIHSTIESKL